MRVDLDHPFPLRECPSCGLDVPSNENRCPICGYEFPTRGAMHRNLWWIALIILLVLLLPLLTMLRS
ncbi:MAG: DUF2116 family Zn-ribbon domain-containing protein [Lentisphaerae bacterium]|jgi:predicted amidophosphoribosyltransferase|nr:DUF2116 family Zn-ribbon domain-containing protein [Lentisphaerota bacterium]